MKTKLMSMINNTKLLSFLICNVVSEKVKKTGEGMKEYLGNEENIKHVSLVAYDLMPLSIKIGMRYEVFYEKFKVVFLGIRNNLFTYEPELRTFEEKKKELVKEDTGTILTAKEKRVTSKKTNSENIKSSVPKKKIVSSPKEIKKVEVKKQVKRTPRKTVAE